MRQLAEFNPTAPGARSVLIAWSLIAVAVALAERDAGEIVWALPLAAVIPVLSLALHKFGGAWVERLSAWPEATVLLALASGVVSVIAALAEVLV